MEDSMTVDFARPILSMPDGSYVVTLDNGWPYNVVQADSSPVVDVPTLWKSIQEWLTAGNKAEEYKPPEAKAIDPDAQIAADIIADFIDSQKQLPKYQAKLTQLKQQTIKVGK